jgi:hypothetical protein
MLTFLLEDRIPHLLVKVNVVAELFQHLPEVHPLHLRTGERKFKLAKNTTTKFLNILLSPICRQPPLKKGNFQMDSSVQNNPAAPTPFQLTLKVLSNSVLV